MKPSRRPHDANQSSRRIFSRQLAPLLSLILCCALLAPLPASTLAGKTMPAQGKGAPQKGQARRVRPDPPQPGAPAASLPNLDEVRGRLPRESQAPPPITSTMRSRHKPLESRHGRRVGDPLPPARRAAVQGSEGGLSPADFHSSSADDEAEGYGFYPTRFLISPSYDQI